MKKRMAVFAYGHNLGDITRAIETARGLMKYGSEVKFYTHGCAFSHHIAMEDLDSEVLQPELSWEKHKVIMDINRYRVPLGTPIPVTEKEWIGMVEADLEAFDSFKPDAVYAGLNLSCMISVPLAKLAMITQVPTVNCPAFIEKELYNMPNTMEKTFFLKYILPGWIKRKIMKKILLGDSAIGSLKSFNAVRKKFGLKPITNIVNLVRGDITLLPDLPELSGLPQEKLTPGYYYTGPIFSRMDLPVPEEVRQVYNRPGLNIFLSFGSSGFPEVLKKVVHILRNQPDFNIVCATTSIVEPSELGPNGDRFFATEYLPAVKVNEMADIAFLHGGQGTIQTAVWAGTPVIGIGFQAEQQANIDGICRAGMARKIPLYSITEKRVLREIQRVQSDSFKMNAQAMSRLVRKTDGVAKTVETIHHFLEGKLGAN